MVRDNIPKRRCFTPLYLRHGGNRVWWEVFRGLTNNFEIAHNGVENEPFAKGPARVLPNLLGAFLNVFKIKCPITRHGSNPFQ